MVPRDRAMAPRPARWRHEVALARLDAGRPRSRASPADWRRRRARHARRRRRLSEARPQQGQPGTSISKSLPRPAAPTPHRRAAAALGLPRPPAAAARRLPAVLASSSRRLASGAMEVEIVRPAPVVAGQAGPAPGAVAVRAAGWIEPDPFAITVSALDSRRRARGAGAGVRCALEAGARSLLIDDDARLGVRQAEAALAEAGVEPARREVAGWAARASFDAALAARAGSDGGGGTRTGRRAEAELRDQAAGARAALGGRVGGGGAAPPRRGGAAGPARRRDSAEAALAGMRGRGEPRPTRRAGARAAARAAGKPCSKRAGRDLELRIEDKFVRDGGGRRTRAGGAARAQVARDEAQLRLERHDRAYAHRRPQQRPSRRARSSRRRAQASRRFYDPLGARAGGRRSRRSAGLHVGQRVLVGADARPGRDYQGEVSRIVRQADIKQGDAAGARAHHRRRRAAACPEMLVQTRSPRRRGRWHRVRRARVGCGRQRGPHSRAARRGGQPGSSSTRSASRPSCATCGSAARSARTWRCSRASTFRQAHRPHLESTAPGLPVKALAAQKER